MMHWAGEHGWAMGWGWLLMVLFWVLVIASVLVLFRKASGSGGVRRTPLDILKERYAKGDIGKEEYEQKRRDLED